MALERFVANTKENLEKEREAEVEESRILLENVSPKEQQRRGVCLLKLRIASRHTGLYGRCVIVLEPYWPSQPLPSHNFTPGDLAGLSLSSSEGGEVIASGTVSRVDAASVSVAFDESTESLDLEDQAQYRIVKLANNVTYKRLKKALDNLNSYHNGPASQLVSVLFGDSEPGPQFSMERDGIKQELSFYNTSLDPSQQEAVAFALCQRELAVIHGPPGTGKTTTVVEVIRQAVTRKMKILVCAPSNIAVDNLVERLAAAKVKVVRLGHPARLLASIQKHSLDAIVSNSSETKLVEDVRRDVDQTLAAIRRSRDKGERQRMRSEVKSLRKELRQREEAAVREVLNRAEVVAATLTSASIDGPLKHLDPNHFDLVVIDECSQALEAACWIALTRAGRCILAGDHHQLPPTILSKKAANDGLELTLMERVLNLHGDGVMRMLTMQYRMHHDIMAWSSQQLYHNKLQAHQSVATHLLSDLPGVTQTEDTTCCLLLVDTAGCGLHELNLPRESSKANEGEADLVAHHVKRLIACGLAPHDIAVIAPYNLQVELLRVRLSEDHPTLEIKSVDGFQGREKEAVIISLVRSNDHGEVGFLAENRRINVAITRARRHLAVVCDSDTVSHHDFLGSLTDYMTEHGEVRSAQQYIDAGATQTEYKRPERLTEQMEDKARTEKKAGETKSARPRRDAKLQTQKTPRHVTNTSRNVGSAQLQDAKASSGETEETLEKQLVGFLMDNSQEKLVFPTSLSSTERFLIHEIAEKLGLLHRSEGEGTDRHMVVGKLMAASQPITNIDESTRGRDCQATNATCLAADSDVAAAVNASGSSSRKDTPQTESSSGSHSHEKSQRKGRKSPGMPAVPSPCDVTPPSNLTDVRCDSCRKMIPKTNYELHTLRCKPNSGAISKDTKTSKPKPKKKNKLTAPQVSDEPQDFDALIAEAMKANSRCSTKKCKNNAATLGQNCEFCAKRFCLTHYIAEAHGCGDRAKEKARMMISREGVLYRGSGVPDKKPSAIKRGHLERKLGNKLDDLANQRKSQKKDK